MAEGRKHPRRARGPAPLPVEPVDLLAGLAPGLELHADGDVEDGEAPAVVSVAEVGKLMRSGDDTIRRLIRTPELRPFAPGEEPEDGDETLEPERAGVVPRSRTRPGE